MAIAPRTALNRAKGACYTGPRPIPRTPALSRWRTGRLVLSVIVLALAAAATAASDAATLERIRERQAIVFAYRDGTAPFSFKDRDGRVRGYSVELCARVAELLKRDLRFPDLRVQWLPVDADTRLDAVASGRADAECGTTTITLSRMETVDFSVPIFVDGGTLLVRAKSPVQRIGDLRSRRVAVIPGTTTERGLRAALDVADVSPRIVPVGKPEEGAAAVREGKADAYAGDRIVLRQLLLRTNDDALAVLGDDFSFEPYGIVLPRNDADFRLAVNRALVSAYKHGDIDAIFQRWLAPLGEPGPLLNAMFYLNALPE
jgi:ABC-type amino acid transport substrate-binding protein